jgi:hypothetical protein
MNELGRVPPPDSMPPMADAPIVAKSQRNNLRKSVELRPSGWPIGMKFGMVIIPRALGRLKL